MDAQKKQENDVPFPSGEKKPEPAREPVPAPEPTRFGDWEINGRCIDF